MAWIHDAPEDDLYEHEGCAVAVFGDGSESDPADWWDMWTAEAVALRAVCACGWSAERVRVLDREADIEAAEEAPARDWQAHIDELRVRTLPKDVTELLAALGSRLTALEGSRPVAAVEALGRLEKLTQAPRSTRIVAKARGEHASWGEIGRALGISKQAAHQRFARLMPPRTADGAPIHIEGCRFEKAAHNGNCACAGLSGAGGRKIPAVLSEDVERARHAAGHDYVHGWSCKCLNCAPRHLVDQDSP